MNCLKLSILHTHVIRYYSSQYFHYEMFINHSMLINFSGYQWLDTASFQAQPSVMPANNPYYRHLLNPQGPLLVYILQLFWVGPIYSFSKRANNLAKSVLLNAARALQPSVPMISDFVRHNHHWLIFILLWKPWLE